MSDPLRILISQSPENLKIIKNVYFLQQKLLWALSGPPEIDLKIDYDDLSVVTKLYVLQYKLASRFFRPT